jgi:transcription factor SOX7/8/10/18 (SOX group E/F)
MLFRADFVRQKHVPGTIETNHSSLSKIIGICWRALPLPEKRIWETKAKKAKAEYKIKYPDYKFRHVHNEQGPAPAASASHPSVPPSQPASRSMSGRTIKSALRPEDKRRCEEVATLLLQGKKGEELAWAVRDFDLRHQVELAEPSQSPIPVIYHQNSSKFPHVVKWEGKTRYIQ